MCVCVCACTLECECVDTWRVVILIKIKKQSPRSSKVVQQYILTYACVCLMTRKAPYPHTVSNRRMSQRWNKDPSL